MYVQSTVTIMIHVIAFEHYRTLAHTVCSCVDCLQFPQTVTYGFMYDMTAISSGVHVDMRGLSRHKEYNVISRIRLVESCDAIAGWSNLPHD